MLDAHDGPETPVWIIEDVHFAAPDLRAVLVHALREPHRRNRLVVLTARPAIRDGGDDDPFTAAGVDILDLEPLSGEATAALIESLTGPGVLPAEVAAGVAAASGGNPLFVEELLRSWLQSGVLRRDPGGTWLFTGDGERPAAGRPAPRAGPAADRPRRSRRGAPPPASARGSPAPFGPPR
jgi:hypothetical protein